MSALNPNHHVTRALEGQWYKLAALVLLQLPDAKATITEENLAELMHLFGGEEPCIVARDDAAGLHLSLVPRSVAEQMAREHGGLPS
ncbi:hypothetical protein [Paraburkholderia sediminicola]|uniref:hypothetical protein n=1 Tax=Paraburkholderia sediminicola TaxID=458836 RepID=UPI0038BD0B16